eukprot:1112288-Pelagomonas_calceolata.AAC.1
MNHATKPNTAVRRFSWSTFAPVPPVTWGGESCDKITYSNNSAKNTCTRPDTHMGLKRHRMVYEHIKRKKDGHTHQQELWVSCASFLGHTAQHISGRPPEDASIRCAGWRRNRQLKDRETSCIDAQECVASEQYSRGPCPRNGKADGDNLQGHNKNDLIASAMNDLYE